MTDTTLSNDNTAPRAPKHVAQAAWRERNQIKVWAHKALASALRRGLVTKQPCEVCGDPNTDGHHDDYDRPMVVRWLCRPHHKAHHAVEKQDRAA